MHQHNIVSPFYCHAAVRLYGYHPTMRCTAVRSMPYGRGRRMTRKAATVQASFNPLLPHRLPYRLCVRARRSRTTHMGGGGGGRGIRV